MSEKDKATTEKNNEQEGTSRAVFWSNGST